METYIIIYWIGAIIVAGLMLLLSKHDEFRNLLTSKAHQTGVFFLLVLGWPIFFLALPILLNKGNDE